tara:strand:- start:1778 stop:2779 length:1002 start_codon:yes stop_codon:yes gene_type:complete
MLRPVCNIKIGLQDFDFVTEGSIVTSWKLFTDTAEITLPHKFKKNDKVIFVGEDNLFKKGDAVTIEAGYFPVKNHLFEGYVTGVKPGIPTTIKMQDPTYLLKQNNLTLSFKSVTLKELITACLSAAKEKSKGYVLEGLNKITVETVEAKLGAFRITNVNIVNVLEELKKTYALTSYMRGHILYVGLAYNGNGKKVKLEFYKDILNDENLEYLKEEDRPIKVKAISMLENNTKIEIELGDPNGEQRTITKYNLSEAQLKEVATREISRLRYEGFSGNFTTFLHTPLYHGDEIEIIDRKTPERNGVYLVEAAEYQIGINGYFQTITLGVRIDARN